MHSQLQTILALLSVSALCSGCQLFDPTMREYETLFKQQKMIIKPYLPEYGSGFVVSMKPEEAAQLNLPNSPEFREMLEKQLSIERSQGKNYCPNGYVIDKVRYFKHWYTKIEVNCM